MLHAHTGEIMKKCRLTVLSTLVLAALNSPAYAEEVIYQQLPYTENPTSSDYFGFFEPADAISGQRNDQITADNFTITGSDAYITKIKWWGGSDNWNSSDNDNFSDIVIKIFTELDFAPDYRNILVGKKIRFAETNLTYVGFGAAEAGALVYEHEVTLDEPLALCEGHEYWLSIGAINVALNSGQLNITTSENGYMWYSAGTPVDGSIWTFNPSDFFRYFPYPPEWSDISGDQAFVLYGTKASFPRVTHCPERVIPDDTDEDTGEDTDETTATPTPTISITPTPTATPTAIPKVPVPAAVWLFGSGLAGLFAVARRRKTRS